MKTLTRYKRGQAKVLVRAVSATINFLKLPTAQLFLTASTISSINQNLSGLKMISQRLEEELIEDLKFFAEFEGMGYQPLMRKVLHRYVEGETKKHLRMQASLQRREAAAKSHDDDLTDDRKRA